MYAVAGVSGNTGRWVAETLLERGAPVRVIVRDAEKGAAWAARGAEVAVADLSDTAALAAALRGVEGLYTLVPPQLGAADPLAAGIEVGRRITAAAKEAGVHVVLLSSVGAQRETGTGPIEILHHTEAALREAGVPATFLRAGYFFENYGMVMQPITSDGVLPSFVAADVPTPTVTVRDIGRKGAELLLEGGQGVRVVELAGPRDITVNEIAAGFSRALGRPIQVVVQPLDAVIPTLAAMGVPTPWTKLYDGLYRGLAAGRVAWEGQPVRGTDDIDAGVRALLG